MRPNDKKIIAQVAKELCLWILVRRTNPASLKYIGMNGYVPKPIHCKAKTADQDVGSAKLAGLVVDPTLQPFAFTKTRHDEAMKEWREHSDAMLASGFTVETSAGDTFGLVRWQGSFVHGDYDLYDIIDPEAVTRNIAIVESLLGQIHRRGAYFFKVQRLINSKIGVPMIQHGGEMQYKDHYEQVIDVFGPNGERKEIPNKTSVRKWYRQQFDGRKNLGGKEQWKVER